MTITSWVNRLNNFINNKLGFCKRCIQIAAVGTILSWALFLFSTLFINSPIIRGLIVLISIGFTFLLIAHLITYLFRVYLPLNNALRNLDVKHGELSISTLKPYHVAGKYKQDNLGVAFEARFQGAQMSINILDLQGKELLIAHENNGMIEQSILGGRMTIKMPKLILAEDMSESELAKLTEQHIANIKIQGEENSFTELQELPEYALLPIISKLLGINGVTGNRFPATLSLHLLALGAFNFQQINGEEHPTDEGHPDVVYRIKHPFQDRLLADLIFDFIDDDIIPCNPLENEIKMYPPGYDEPWYGGCNSTTGCKKSKCKCADNKPNRDEDCVGMCGKGCCCWCWVCGDCCFHRGCFVHDIACGGCHDSFGLNVAACTVCYSPIAGIGFIC